MRFQVFDMNAAEREMVADLLKALGHKDEATRPDVLLAAYDSDLRGDLLRLASQKGGPAVIFYGENPSPAEISTCILEGASEFLMKPFDADLLRFKLEQAGIAA